MAFKKVNVNFPFIEFKTENDCFQGTLIEIKKMYSKLQKSDQIIWLCSATTDAGKYADSSGKTKKTLKTVPGEIYQISEKTVMQNFRASMDPGQEFLIVYTGEKLSDKGTKYKSFDFFIDE